MTSILKLPATTIGLLMLSSPAMMAVVAPLSGYISDKIGPLRMMPAAVLIFLAAQICLAFLRPDSTLAHVLIGLMLLGVGMGAMTPPTDSGIMTSAGLKNSGYASGFINTVRNLSISIGTAASAGAFTFLRDSSMRSMDATAAYMNAFRFVFLATAGFTFVNFTLCLWLGRFKNKTESS